ncbi:MAG: DUF2971 domain-containing protein [Proteobacteria bacterium]|nr:DUF2971 domain-containing protein [Pseudomonadota bacterium]
MDLESLLMKPMPRVVRGNDQRFHEDPSQWKPEKPLGSATLWKYMSFSKFMFLLHHKALFFSLVRKMEDKYEGFIQAPKQSDFEAESTVYQILSEMKQNTIVCCWTKSEYESNVMWKSYAGTEGEGIAIKTTCRDLLESVDSTAQSKLTLGKVEYVNYDQNRIPINDLAPLFHKRIEFRSEEEVRVAAALHFEFEGPQIVISPEIEKNGGLYIQVDLNKLVNEVVVSPNSEPWFNELVYRQIEQASLKVPVVPSTI